MALRVAKRRTPYPLRAARVSAAYTPAASGAIALPASSFAPRGARFARSGEKSGLAGSPSVGEYEPGGSRALGGDALSLTANLWYR
jgi:hypothetical protein